MLKLVQKTPLLCILTISLLQIGCGNVGGRVNTEEESSQRNTIEVTDKSGNSNSVNTSNQTTVNNYETCHEMSYLPGANPSLTINGDLKVCEHKSDDGKLKIVRTASGNQELCLIPIHTNPLDGSGASDQAYVTAPHVQCGPFGKETFINVELNSNQFNYISIVRQQDFTAYINYFTGASEDQVARFITGL